MVCNQRFDMKLWDLDAAAASVGPETGEPPRWKTRGFAMYST